MRERVREIAEQLSAAGLDEAEIKAEWLLCHLLDVSRHQLGFSGREPDAAKLKAAVERLCCGEPLQYVIGTSDFRGHLLACDARALIPRPETEQLVDLALACRGEDFIDVGTGSGCIAISLALEHPRARVTATDVSAAALALACENAERHNAAARVRFTRADLLDGIPAASADVVVSNPPYIESGEIPALAREIREFEPRSALDGGADGLDLVRRLVRQAARVVRPGGSLLLETGETQGARVAELYGAAGFVGVEVKRDLAGHDRFVVGCRA